MKSTLTSKGQATIPREIRDHLKLKPGSKLKFFIHPDGSVVLLPILPASSLRGFLPYAGKPVSIAEMKDAISAGAAGEPRKRR